MNFKDLKYFLAVVELKHFGKAAERCEISQPTLSSQIKKLEQTLNVTLFERTNRYVVLTEVAKQIADYARQIIYNVESIQEIAKNSTNTLERNFRLGAFPTLAPYIFPKIVPKIQNALPKLSLILIEKKTDYLVQKLKDGEIDAALLALPVPIHDDSFFIQTLFKDDFYLAVSIKHELANSSIIEQEWLRDYSLLLLEEGHCLREQSLEVCKQYAIKTEKNFKTTGLETLKQMVKSNLGITLMPKIAMNKEEKDICYIPFKNPIPRRTIALIWRKASLKSNIVNQILDAIKDI